MSSDNPFDPSSSTTAVPAASSVNVGHKTLSIKDLGTVSGLALATFVLGGYLSGLAIDEFGTVGAIALWATGGIAGLLAAKLVRPNKIAGYSLAAAVVLAFVFAEICWIHWNIVGAETWPAAIGMFPAFLDEYRVPALIGSIFAFFGAASAYRQAGIRYRFVQVADA